MTRIGIVAGEPSGDQLGAPLMDALRERYPDAVFEGVGGPLMQAAGCISLHDFERLCVMGLVEVLGRYRELKSMREQLVAHFIANPPDLFIGIDSPDFTLGLEERLHAAGIKTVHYVSPSVWAWRKSRLRLIKRATDLMLTLFPFEEKFYLQHGIPVCCTGHSMADRIPLQPDRSAAREELGLPADKTLIALLPGSRRSELKRLTETFIRTAVWCHQQQADIEFVAALVNDQAVADFQALKDEIAADLPIYVMQGNSHRVMEAADLLLIASGTATLEGLLYKRPMVVAYKMAWLTYFIFRAMTRLPFYALPNILSGRALVPEYIQYGVRPEVLGPELLSLLQNPQRTEAMISSFDQIHRSLQCGGSRRAAQAISELLSA